MTDEDRPRDDGVGKPDTTVQPGEEDENRPRLRRLLGPFHWLAEHYCSTPAPTVTPAPAKRRPSPTATTTPNQPSPDVTP